MRSNLTAARTGIDAAGDALDGIEKAVRSYIKAGGRELRGTRIFETTSAVVS